MKYSEKDLVERLCQDNKEVILSENNLDIQSSRNYIRPAEKSTHKFIHLKGANMIESVSRNYDILLIKSETIRDYTGKFEKGIHVKIVLPQEEIKNCYSGTITNDTMQQVLRPKKLVSPPDCISYEGIVLLSFNSDYGK
jgi:hypothetical protein